MAKRRRKNRNRARRGMAVASQGVEAAPSPSAFSGYDGANFSKRRGQVWWPTLDTRQELDGFSRSELVRRVRWLYGNVGLGRRLIRGLAEMIGYLSPQAATSDDDWNERAEANFRNRAGARQVFDRAGKVNFFTAQPMLNRAWLRDGDMLTVMTETGSGGAQFAFFEGTQLESPAKGGKNWTDGVRVSPHGRHMAYGLRRDNGEPYVVPAKNAIYYGEFDTPGHPRAVPPLAHAVNHAMDITEIWSDVKTAIKVNSLSGVVRTKKDATGEYRGKQGLVGAVKKETQADGSQINIEQVYGAGQIPSLAAGEDLKIVSDPRPAQNQRDQIGDLIRDVSWGLGLPPEVVWQMSGLTGPGVRFVLELAARWIAARQLELESWCRVVWVRHCAKEMAAGRLREPTDPEWWKVTWVPQRSMTIDRGRDGAQRMNEIDRGMGTLSDWHKEVSGADWQNKLRQRVAEVKFLRALCDEEGVAYQDIIAPRQGAAPAAEEKESKKDETAKKEESPTK